MPITKPMLRRQKAAISPQRAESRRWRRQSRKRPRRESSNDFASVLLPRPRTNCERTVGPGLAGDNAVMLNWRHLRVSGAFQFDRYPSPGCYSERSTGRKMAGFQSPKRPEKDLLEPTKGLVQAAFPGVSAGSS